jgi:RNA polymerase sigma-70 factor (ECF subfamily)
MTTTDIAATETYVENRERMLGVAYRILGRVADAEDVVQEAWLRWTRVSPDEVDNPRAFLTQVTARLALDRLRRIKARHEAYTGTWLPEPNLTTPDAAEDIELAESASMAMMVVLETLSPLERAVFVLNEAFAVPYAELATILGRSETGVRQVAHRARKHVEERKPRFESTPSSRRAVVQKFIAASSNGDLLGLLAVLSPEVELVSDGGGLVRAPLKTLFGVENVSRFLMAVGQGIESGDIHLTELNGTPALLVGPLEAPTSAVLFDIDDGRVARIYLVATPLKLERLRKTA